MTETNRTTAAAAIDDGAVLNHRARAAAPAALAILVGALFIVGAGFAHSATVHNAAHDARHAFAFPCH